MQTNSTADWTPHWSMTDAMIYAEAALAEAQWERARAWLLYANTLGSIDTAERSAADRAEFLAALTEAGTDG